MMLSIKSTDARNTPRGKTSNRVQNGVSPVIRDPEYQLLVLNTAQLQSWLMFRKKKDIVKIQTFTTNM